MVDAISRCVDDSMDEGDREPPPPSEPPPSEPPPIVPPPSDPPLSDPPLLLVFPCVLVNITCDIDVDMELL